MARGAIVIIQIYPLKFSWYLNGIYRGYALALSSTSVSTLCIAEAEHNNIFSVNDEWLMDIEGLGAYAHR